MDGFVLRIRQHTERRIIKAGKLHLFVDPLREDSLDTQLLLLG
jgi:hypothetical protein